MFEVLALRRALIELFVVCMCREPFAGARAQIAGEQIAKLTPRQHRIGRKQMTGEFIALGVARSEIGAFGIKIEGYFLHE